MAMIYAMASRVIVWIGESEDNSDQALEEIHKSTDEQPTENHGEIRRAVIKLLLLPWFRRIWVLQEVAAARNVVILCGSTEIDGYVFCIGVNALKLTYQDNPGLGNLIRTATYLIRRTGFWPKKATSESRIFSLNIGLLSELIDMYHGREASDPRDKIYALLGMSSNSYSLTPDYNITWQTLFERVIRHIICKQVSVTTWHDREVAVIKSKGCALGYISSVKSDTTWDYKQHIIILCKE
ncbi:uncharacterized protein TrAFT101_010062 [Trichoderma asperellum]|uniref:uncharacterized protein n=1 Tax=Trichoderma asperellum TaxID=101201 RepID=UPI00331D420D|nr:hypothetical protein TrAFT101_010062 [Trichoderma asperellum]